MPELADPLRMKPRADLTTRVELSVLHLLVLSSKYTARPEVSGFRA